MFYDDEIENQDVCERILKVLLEKNITYGELSKRTGIPKTTLYRYATGETKKIPTENLKLIANATYVPIEWFITGKVYHQLQPDLSEDNLLFPVIGDLAAGFDRIAIEDWGGETIEIPKSYLKGRKKEEFIVLAVKGDSMYPLYQDGDKVLILRENTVPYSGAVCAVLYGDEFATLKKVELLDGRIRLVPINLNYGPYTIEGEEMTGFKVIGIPKLLIREIIED